MYCDNEQCNNKSQYVTNEVIDLDYNNYSKIDFLLGVSVYAEIILSDLRKGGRNMPIAQNTHTCVNLTGS